MLNLQHSLQRAAFGLEDDGLIAERTRTRERVLLGPKVIEVSGLHKTFRIPDQRVDTIKERVAHPLRQIEYRELKALRGISFEVHQGEFFGIVGRNGSGKSTLLKVLASIYRADSGRIRIAGRLAPFIELGVGFNPELTARENVELNGVMMGLGRREARRRLDSVLEFAELTEFVDLKLKNYSSGMMVRLAFAVMVEADADVMLVDEVLAVGDAAFAQKCTDVFREKRSSGKTLVLVTHDMASVQAFCDRAMLIHDGEQRYLGDPEEAALRYYRLNFAGHSATGGHGPVSVPDVNVNLLDVWLEDESGARVDNVEQDKMFRFNLLAEARQDMNAPVFNFHCLNMDGHWVFAFSKAVEGLDGEPRRVLAGERVRIVAEIDNPLVPGRYALECWISRNREAGAMAIHILRLLDFFVFGTKPGAGNIAMTGEVEAVIETAARA
jgi:ABC-type polysaccharide/polyol phosphate transport system ATPase subunit